MELEQARQRAEELRRVIEKNNRLYYDQDAPELEDYEYDALVRELTALEEQFPQLVTPASPTQHVGGTASSKFSKVTHAVKMESLQDAFSFDELRDFDARVRDAGITPEYVVEVKIDGLSVSLEYQNGTFVRGSTRGDGVVGEDVTENLAAIPDIPKQLVDAPEFLEVRGEVYMPHDAFFRLKEQQELEDKTPFKNPRKRGGGFPAPEGRPDHCFPGTFHLCVQSAAGAGAQLHHPFPDAGLYQVSRVPGVAPLQCLYRH